MVTAEVVGCPKHPERKSSVDGILGCSEGDLGKGTLDTTVAKDGTPACPGSAEEAGKDMAVECLSPFVSKGSTARMGPEDTRVTLSSKERKSCDYGEVVFLDCFLGNTVDQVDLGLVFGQRSQVARPLRGQKDVLVAVLRLRARIASLAKEGRVGCSL